MSGISKWRRSGVSLAENNAAIDTSGNKLKLYRLAGFQPGSRDCGIVYVLTHLGFKYLGLDVICLNRGSHNEKETQKKIDLSSRGNIQVNGPGRCAGPSIQEECFVKNLIHTRGRVAAIKKCTVVLAKQITETESMQRRNILL